MEDKHFQGDSVREEEEVRSMQSEITILLPSSQESELKEKYSLQIGCSPSFCWSEFL